MRLDQAIVVMGIAYYIHGCDQQALRRAANVCLPKLSPGNKKPIRLLMTSSQPEEVLRLTLEEVFPTEGIGAINCTGEDR